MLTVDLKRTEYYTECLPGRSAGVVLEEIFTLFIRYSQTNETYAQDFLHKITAALYCNFVTIVSNIVKESDGYNVEIEILSDNVKLLNDIDQEFSELAVKFNERII